MTATLHIEAPSTKELLAELRGVARDLGVTPSLAERVAAAQAAGATELPPVGRVYPANTPAWNATLAEAPYDLLLAEAMRRAAAKGFVLTLNQEDTATIQDPRQQSADLDDVSGGGDGTPAAEGEDAAEDTAQAAAPAASAQPEVDEAAIRQKAIDVLMSVYARGKAGQAECRKVREKMGVKKFADVPLSQAAQLLEMANAADAAVPAEGGAS